MEFTYRKFQRSEASKLRRTSLDAIKPYSLLLAPVYVFMKRNAKFLAVKGPLDFFTQEELQKLRAFDTIFLPEFIQVALPFRDAAKSVRLTLSWRPRTPSGPAEEDGVRLYPEIPLPPAPYEMSDAVLKIIGPLWGAGGVIEPYFVTVFAHEVCDALPHDWMKKMREADHLKFENTLFLSSWGVFLALHLGKCDLAYLSRLRAQIFVREFPNVVTDTEYLGAMDPWSAELLEVAKNTIKEPTQVLKAEDFAPRDEKVSQMLMSRLNRVISEFVRKDRPPATVFGEKGLIVETYR